MRDEILTRAFEAAGGVAALAAKLGVTSQAVSQWTRIPAERTLAVEAATGGKIARHELRPDLYPPPEPDLDRSPPVDGEGTGGTDKARAA